LADEAAAVRLDIAARKSMATPEEQQG